MHPFVAYLLDQHAHVVQTGGLHAGDELGGLHSALGEDLAGVGDVADLHHLVMSGEDDLMLAHDGTAANGGDTDLLFFAGMAGAVTFKNARKPREVAEVVPEDKLLIETDCPYMTPVPYRGQRCDSSFIPHTAQVIAEVRGVTAEEILDITRRNANKLFGLEL